MEREACVCDHGLERSDLFAEIIIIMIITIIIITIIMCSCTSPYHQLVRELLVANKQKTTRYGKSFTKANRDDLWPA